jgi:16S rRNA (guanine527-N7)-methyltransferase
MKQFDRDHIADTLQEGARKLQVVISVAQMERLLDYLALLIKWNGVYNLTAVRDPEQMVVQHLLDSLAVVPAFVEAKNVLDVGAGGGLPGIVLAIWAAEANPLMHVSMIDTVHKKTAFLTQVRAELKLQNVTIYTARVEQLQVTQRFDVITSRAFAELADFINWSAHLLAQDGKFIAMKGVMPTDEIERLPAGWYVQKSEKLIVPELSAERHLIFIQRDTDPV